MSIANKIYTFPKVILSVLDVISSSSESQYSEEEEVLQSMQKNSKQKVH